LSSMGPRGLGGFAYSSTAARTTDLLVSVTGFEATWKGQRETAG